MTVVADAEPTPDGPSGRFDRLSRGFERRGPGAIGVSGVTILLVAVVLVALAGGRLLFRGPGGSPVTVDAETFLASVEAATPGAPRLGPATWETDAAIGREVASWTLGSWGRFELYRDDDGMVTASDLVAQPRTVAEEDAFRSLATATVAAALQVEADAADVVLGEDLGADGTGAGTVTSEVERAGVGLALHREGGTWQLRTTHPAVAR